MKLSVLSLNTVKLSFQPETMNFYKVRLNYLLFFDILITRRKVDTYL